MIASLLLACCSCELSCWVAEIRATLYIHDFCVVSNVGEHYSFIVILALVPS